MRYKINQCVKIGNKLTQFLCITIDIKIIIANKIHLYKFNHETHKLKKYKYWNCVKADVVGSGNVHPPSVHTYIYTLGQTIGVVGLVEQTCA